MIMAPNLLMIAAVDLPGYVNFLLFPVFVMATLDTIYLAKVRYPPEEKKKLMTELFPRAVAPLLLSTSSYY